MSLCCTRVETVFGRESEEDRRTAREAGLKERECVSDTESPVGAERDTVVGERTMAEELLGQYLTPSSMFPFDKADSDQGWVTVGFINGETPQMIQSVFFIFTTQRDHDSRVEKLLWRKNQLELRASNAGCI